MKKLWSKAKWAIAGSVTLFGSLFVWWNVTKNPGTKPEVIGGINQDTLIHIHADSIKTDSAKLK